LWQISVLFTPLESPAIYGGDDIDKILIPYRKGGVKAPSFLTGFTLYYRKLDRPQRKNYFETLGGAKASA